MIQYPVASEGLDRLGTLYSVLAGLPGDQVNLNLFFNSEEFDTRSSYKLKKALDPKHRCGTIACAAGWAAVYPPFNALGLRPTTGGTLKFGRKENYSALAAFFGVSYFDASALFGPRSVASGLTEGLHLMKSSHRRIALHRIRRYLLVKGAIGEKRSDELSRSELIQERGYLAGRV